MIKPMPTALTKTNSLSFRINAAIWTVCAAIVLVFGLFFYSFEYHQRQAQIEQAKILLGTIYLQKREDLANEIFSGHSEALARTLFDIKSIKGIGAVNVFNIDGQLLESLGVYRDKTLLSETRRLLEKGPLFDEVALDKRSHISYTTVIEVIGERLGYFCVFFDLSDIKRASHQRILLIIAVFGSMLVVLSIVLHRLLTVQVIQPVSRLRTAMDQVMKGRLGEQVKLTRNDEIGEVAHAFNAMSSQLEEQHQRLVRSMEARDSYAHQLEETNRKLARLNADLESIVEERTRELRTSYEQLQAEIHERIRADQEKRALEERLARSQKMEALGLLAGGVAHDLNNVLSGIVSYPELLLMDLPDDDPMCKMVLAIQSSGQKAAAIVQDLLTLARRGVTHTEVLNLNADVIQDYLDSPEFNKMRSYHTDVEIDAQLTRDLLNIKGSAIHLKKAIMNLVSNAAEAQPDGGRIIVATENRYVDQPLSGYDHVNEGDYVVLKVEDHGFGIATEDLNRIFEPFYTKKVMGRSGTGLGMAVVWGTVQDHNGYINVDSQVGKGTCFELYFPVTRELQQAAMENACIDDFMGMGETVLVIDDVQEQRNIASTMLTRLKYDVITTDSGESAITYLKKHAVDIVVLDMIMDPGIDGLDTYKQIVTMHPGQKAIIASGYAESERVKEAQSLGAGAYIRKPYTLEKLAMAIREELGY